ncbi:YbaK/EbsC family protein [Actinomycetes bacterium NPDC127524]
MTLTIDSVKSHLRKIGREGDILEFDQSSATVELAAAALEVEPARIAKTLSFRGEGERALLIVSAGNTKIDNKKFKKTFGFKARFLSPAEVLEQTGHEVGGVCPFGLKNDCDVFIDISVKEFDTLFPACGSSHSAIELTKEELFQISGAKEWVDVCKLQELNPAN